MRRLCCLILLATAIAGCSGPGAGSDAAPDPGPGDASFHAEPIGQAYTFGPPQWEAGRWWTYEETASGRRTTTQIVHVGWPTRGDQIAVAVTSDGEGPLAVEASSALFGYDPRTLLFVDDWHTGRYGDGVRLEAGVGGFDARKAGPVAFPLEPDSSWEGTLAFHMFTFVLGDAGGAVQMKARAGDLHAVTGPAGKTEAVRVDATYTVSGSWLDFYEADAEYDLEWYYAPSLGNVVWTQVFPNDDAQVIQLVATGTDGPTLTAQEVTGMLLEQGRAAAAASDLSLSLEATGFFDPEAPQAQDLEATLSRPLKGLAYWNVFDDQGAFLERVEGPELPGFRMQAPGLGFVLLEGRLEGRAVDGAWAAWAVPWSTSLSVDCPQDASGTSCQPTRPFPVSPYSTVTVSGEMSLAACSVVDCGRLVLRDADGNEVASAAWAAGPFEVAAQSGGAGGEWTVGWEGSAVPQGAATLEVEVVPDPQRAPLGHNL